jgi:Protein of unknown function (DUF2958)
MRNAPGCLRKLDEGLLFGLCDLGMGQPELGYVSLIELGSVRGKLGLPAERDRHFVASKTISAYADEAQGRIIALLTPTKLAGFVASSPKATSSASIEAPYFTHQIAALVASIGDIRAARRAGDNAANCPSSNSATLPSAI